MIIDICFFSWNTSILEMRENGKRVFFEIVLATSQLVVAISCDILKLQFTTHYWSNTQLGVGNETLCFSFSNCKEEGKLTAQLSSPTSPLNYATLSTVALFSISRDPLTRTFAPFVWGHLSSLRDPNHPLISSTHVSKSATHVSLIYACVSMII